MDSLPDCTCWSEWHRCFHDASPSLNTLRRAFTSLIRWAFMDPDKMADYGDVLGCYAYTPGSTTNRLEIAPSSVINPGNTQNVPGILISFQNGVTYNPVAVSPEINESEDTGSTEFISLASTELTILCRDFDADICCAMGDLCAMFLFAMYERLMDTWSWLKIYRLVSQSEPKITSKSDTDTTKWYESTVTFHLEYDYRVFVGRESKRMKDFSIDTTPADSLTK